MRLFLIPALALTATSAFAAPAHDHFTRDGYSYDYTQSRKADGSLELQGRVAETGAAFTLRVATTGRVTGIIGDTRVSFTAPKATMDALAAPGDTRIAAAN
jgi:hypothetical protein